MSAALKKAWQDRRIARSALNRTAEACTRRDEAATRIEAEVDETKARQIEGASAGTLSFDDAAGANQIVTLEARLQICNATKASLDAAYDKAKGAVAKCETALQAATHRMLLDGPQKEAMQRFTQWLEEGAQHVFPAMAADYLAFKEYHDPSRPERNWRSEAEAYGPAAVLLETLAAMSWPDFPYATRPSWLPRHGKVHFYRSPEIQAAQAEIRAAIQAASE